MRQLFCFVFAAAWLAAGCGADSNNPSGILGTGGNGGGGNNSTGGSSGGNNASGGSSGGVGTGGDNGGSGGDNGGVVDAAGTGGDNGGGPDAGGTGGDNGGSGGAGPADGGGMPTGNSTGLPRDTMINALDDTQSATLCDWWNTKQGGYGQSAQCAGGNTESDDGSQDECLASLSDCDGATVADFEDCGNAIGADLCMFRTNAACATLSACFTADDPGDPGM